MFERRYVHLDGFGRKYRLWNDGDIERWDGEEYVEVSASGNPPRVRLYRLGVVYRPHLHVLLREAFGEGGEG